MNVLDRIIADERAKSRPMEARAPVIFPALSLLGVMLITLKLGGVIDWSWWLVLSPLLAWMPTAAFVIAVGRAMAIVVARRQRRR